VKSASFYSIDVDTTYLWHWHESNHASERRIGTSFCAEYDACGLWPSCLSSTGSDLVSFYCTKILPTCEDTKFITEAATSVMREADEGLRKFMPAGQINCYGDY